MGTNLVRKRKILFSLESRATYGYSKNVMLAMQKFPEFEISTLVTGMHLVSELGNSIDLIREDGFPITEIVEMHASGEERSAWSAALGAAIEGYAKAFERINPDLLLISGDRIESFGCCVAAAYMGLPVAHVQAGDKSGHIDDAARMALAKLAHVHFASCQDSADRVRKLGEQEFRIFNVGAPQLDDIEGVNYISDSVVIHDREYDLSQPYLLLVQHPVLVEADSAFEQMSATIKACVRSGLKVYCIHPNSDFGYGRILAALKAIDADNRFVSLKNVDRRDYLRLLANATALIGNSSSGILEAPSFKIPTLNIGNRQRGRQQAANIYNCGYGEDDILGAISYITENSEFREACCAAVNPYGDGKSGKRICEILRNINLDQKLLDKETVY